MGVRSHWAWGDIHRAVLGCQTGSELWALGGVPGLSSFPKRDDFLRADALPCRLTLSRTLWNLRRALILAVCGGAAILRAVHGAADAGAPGSTGPGVRVTALPTPPPGQPGFTLLAPAETGITFTNSLSDWAAAENRVLNNGAGLAVGDFDNDGWVDLFFCSLNNGPRNNRLFRNLGGWRFEDVTEQVGLSFKPGYYRGAVFADLNGDGWLDLLVGTLGDGVLCLLNDGRGKFIESTAASGLAGTFPPTTFTLADIDGNGTLDLYVANYRKDDIRDWLRVPVMLVNKRPTVPPQLRERLLFENGVLLEYGEPDLLFLNDGRGHFTLQGWTDGRFLSEVGQPLTEPPRDWGLTAAFRDLNDDGAPDLFVCNDYWTPDRIWLNSGAGRFRAIDPLAVRKSSASAMGVGFADVNRDGYLDIFVVDMLSRSAELRKRQMLARRGTAPKIGEIDNRPQTPQNTLLLNRGDGTYAEIAQLAGLTASEWSWFPLFLDVDLDGYDDLIIPSGHFHDIQDMDANDRIRTLQDQWRRAARGTNLQPAFVAAKREHTKLYPPLDTPVVAFRNRGDLRFEERTREWGLDHPAVNNAIVAADFDNDGDLDVAVNRLQGPPGIFRNDTPAPRIAVRLRGKAPNTQAVGAWVELLGGAAPHQRQEVVAGGVYQGGSDPLLVFAPGTNQQGLRFRVTWRDGSVSEITEVQPNRRYELDQGRIGVVPVPASVLAKAGGTSVPLFTDVSAWLGHAHHEKPFDDFERQPLLPRRLSQSGPGVAWFDVNQDGWEDLVFPSGKGGQLGVFSNKQGKGFERTTAPPFGASVPRDQTGVLGWSRGSTKPAILVGSASYEDGDSRSSCVQVCDLASGTREGRFPGHTSSVGALALADFDADGDLDLFVGGQVIPGRFPEPASSLLFRQTNGQWVLDADNSRALAQVGLVNGAVWSDLDGDGFAELVLACEWGPIRVFHNRSGALSEVTESWGLAGFTGLWQGVTTGDLDGDGQLEIIAGNWGFNSPYRTTVAEPLLLFWGDLAGRGTVDILEAEFDPARRQQVPRLQRDALAGALPFVAERFPTHTAFSRATIADVLQDRPSPVRELRVTTLASAVFFRRARKFVPQELPLEAQFSPAFGVNVADLDGDGIEDVFLSQNFFAFRYDEARLDAGRGLVLRGDGRGGFTPVPGKSSGIRIYGEQRGSALADFDHDGRTDLVVAQNGAATKLYQNTGAQPGLRVRLRGPAENPDGIGAVVRLKFGDMWGAVREIHAGSGYWSQDSAVPVLGAPRSPTAIRVRWPGGHVSDSPLSPGNRQITLTR
jgi:enediyne biosynthesis protein E4